MALNLNTSPYFDNFDRAKKFARILFKPGVAVQARELTQLQTILQDTIGNFADHMFKDGARVKGASGCLLYTSPSPRDTMSSRMPSSA